MSDPGKKGKPTAIADALASFLKASGLHTRVERSQILVHWPEIVGEQIASVTVPRMVTEDGTLFVGVKTHGWMSELSLMERTLLAKINAVPGPPGIRRIRWELLR